MAEEESEGWGTSGSPLWTNSLVLLQLETHRVRPPSTIIWVEVFSQRHINLTATQPRQIHSITCLVKYHKAAKYTAVSGNTQCSYSYFASSMTVEQCSRGPSEWRWPAVTVGPPWPPYRWWSTASSAKCPGVASADKTQTTSSHIDSVLIPKNWRWLQVCIAGDVGTVMTRKPNPPESQPAPPRSWRAAGWFPSTWAQAVTSSGSSSAWRSGRPDEEGARHVTAQSVTLLITLATGSLVHSRII